jgi:threonine efflux protein
LCGVYFCAIKNCNRTLFLLIILNRGENDSAMIDTVNLPLILSIALVAVASPGPATLAIAGTSMGSGRKHGVVLASGIMTGSLFWSISAAFGLGAVMLANAWMFEIVRYFGAAYLLFLAYQSTKSVFLSSSAKKQNKIIIETLRAAYLKGLAIHITNPKAILFFGSLFSIGVPANASLETLLTVIAAIAIQSAFVFFWYALIFSSAPVAAGYVKLKRWFDAVFALVFGAAGLRFIFIPLE